MILSNKLNQIKVMNKDSRVKILNNIFGILFMRKFEKKIKTYSIIFLEFLSCRN